MTDDYLTSQTTLLSDLEAKLQVIVEMTDDNNNSLAFQTINEADVIIDAVVDNIMGKYFNKEAYEINPNYLSEIPEAITIQKLLDDHNYAALSKQITNEMDSFNPQSGAQPEEAAPRSISLSGDFSDAANGDVGHSLISYKLHNAQSHIETISPEISDDSLRMHRSIEEKLESATNTQWGVQTMGDTDFVYVNNEDLPRITEILNNAGIESITGEITNSSTFENQSITGIPIEAIKSLTTEELTSLLDDMSLLNNDVPSEMNHSAQPNTEHGNTASFSVLGH